MPGLKLETVFPGGTIGILGGGQLAKMISIAAANLGYKTHIFTPDKCSPALHSCFTSTIANFSDTKSLQRFAKQVDIITYEFENIDFKAVKYLERIGKLRPNSHCIYIAQNRLREKNFIKELGIPTAAFTEVKSKQELKEVFARFGRSILKTAEQGYDGKGQVMLKSVADVDSVAESFFDFRGQDYTAILEEFVNFKLEISVIITRNADGKSVCFPIGQNTHKNGILMKTIVPAQEISEKLAVQAKRYAKKIVDKLDLIGLLAVEFFVTRDDVLLVNEIAPRPHNSGHWTLDGCVTDQFEQLVRTICNLPFGSVEQTHKVTMKNILGDTSVYLNVLNNKNSKLYLYGKGQAKPNRKMGHVNIIEKT